jgi:hypothetical protein
LGTPLRYRRTTACCLLDPATMSRACQLRRRLILRLVLLIWTVCYFVTPSAASEVTQGHKQCYYPSGGLAPGLPCFPDRPNSQCCGFGWTCLSNGLCKTGPSNEKNFKSQFYRAGCTDQTWNSTSCAQFCRASKFTSTARTFSDHEGRSDSC